MPHPYSLLLRIFVAAVLLLCLVVFATFAAVIKAMLFDAPPTRDRRTP